MKKALCVGYDELYEEYINWQQSKTSRQGFQTVKNRTFRLLKHLEEQELNPCNLTVQDALEYKAVVASRLTKDGKQIKTGSCCNQLKTARSFFGYLVKTGRRESNPFLAVPYPRQGEYISRNVLSEAQMHILLQEFRQFSDNESYRVHVLSELLYATGLRLAEAANLLPQDIDTEQRLVYVRSGKGGKSRTAFLTSYAATVLACYKKQGRKAIISIYSGKRKAKNSLFAVDYPRLQEIANKALREACTKLELPVITSHGFRHSLGTHLLRSGCDMRHIQIILGHEKLGTTQIYTHVNKDEIKASLDAHHPRKWKKEGSA